MTRLAHDYMLTHWPDATSLRFEGECDICHEHTLYSAQTDEDRRLERSMPLGESDGELCGYFCIACDWSNAGRRHKEMDE